jgi:hypothetical protein
MLQSWTFGFLTNVSGFNADYAKCFIDMVLNEIRQNRHKQYFVEWSFVAARKGSENLEPSVFYDESILRGSGPKKKKKNARRVPSSDERPMKVLFPPPGL